LDSLKWTNIVLIVTINSKKKRLLFWSHVCKLCCCSWELQLMLLFFFKNFRFTNHSNHCRGDYCIGFY
jgi:hypothetical protein